MIVLVRSAAIFIVLATASWAAAKLEPRVELGRVGLDLAELIPQRFGDWSAEPSQVAQVLLVPNVRVAAEAAQSGSYDDVLMRTYRRADGARVMIALAYGARQTQELKIHRPELCYYAQGFEVRSLGHRAVPVAGAASVEALALVARSPARTEIVTYWIRIGERIASGPWDMRWTIFREGLRGRVPDGLLLRASSLADSPAAAERELALQREFLADLQRELPRPTRRLLIGGAEAVL